VFKNNCSLLILLIVFLIIPFDSFAEDELSIQGSNEMRLAKGTETIGVEEGDKVYFENRLNFNLYYGNFTGGTRFTLLRPSELHELQKPDDIGLKTIEKRYIEYSNPDHQYQVRLGDFYTVWGRGLTLALYEDIVIGFDSGLEGGQFKISRDNFEFEAISGWSTNGYQGLVRKAQVSGAHIDYTLPKGFGIGLQAISVTPVEIDDEPTYDEANQTVGGYLRFDGSSLSFWAEHAQEFIEDVDDDFFASYASASYFVGNLGVLVDYKRYKYYKYSSPETVSDNYKTSTHTLSFHNAPIVQREFTSPLFAKHPHLVNFDNEVGIQVELTYTPFEWGTFILAMAQSNAMIHDDLFIPGLKEENSPYRELFLELNAYPSSTWSLIGWLGTSEELIYNFEAEARTDWKRRQVLGTLNEFSVNSDWSVKASAEVADVSDIITDESFNDGLFTLGLNFRTQYTLAATIEVTGQEGLDKDQWIKIDGRAFIADRHEIIFTYGSERGGLVCTSGKCRLVNPFEGFKVTITSLF
jgi:Family of unknown function (DUF6029)